MVMHDMNVDTCKHYSLSWSEFSSSLSMAVQNLRNKEDLIDVTISAGGKNFPAHKLVLGAASPLLMDLLKNTTCQHPILMLAGISACDLETILEFVYHGEINIDVEKLPSLLQAAQFLDIRALSPAALVLNSSQSPLPLFTPAENKNTDKNPPTNEKYNENEEKNCETQISLQKRKRTMKLVDNVCQKARIDFNSSTKNVTKIFKRSTENEKMQESTQETPPGQPKVNEPSVPQEGIFTNDEKKIISDLPVNCKLCGVTIRQSRNLRRHIDQMHSKIKGQKIEDPKEKKGGNDKSKSKIILPKNDASNTSFLDFSDDSFNQLTEEIFNYSTIPDTISSTNSLSNSLSISSVTPVDNGLIEEIRTPQNTTTISTLTSPSTLLYSFPGGPTPQSLSTLLGDFCFHLPTTTTMTMTTSTASIGDKSSTISDSRSSVSFEYTNLDDDCCNSGDSTQDMMTFKELDNQLLSGCFCSAENEV